jgi:hypothetical protein
MSKNRPFDPIDYLAILLALAMSLPLFFALGIVGLLVACARSVYEAFFLAYARLELRLGTADFRRLDRAAQRVTAFTLTIAALGLLFLFAQLGLYLFASPAGRALGSR